MVSLFLTRLTAVASAFLFFGRVHSVPTNVTTFEGLGQQARDVLARATPAAPHFVVYADSYVSGTNGPPATSAVTVWISSNSLYAVIHVGQQGFNVL